MEKSQKQPLRLQDEKMLSKDVAGLEGHYASKKGGIFLNKGELQQIQDYSKNLNEKNPKAHDPLVFPFLNFLKAISFALIAALFIFNSSIKAQDALSSLKSKVSGAFSSFSANFSVTNSGGSLSGGKIYYQYPNKLRVNVSGGGVIATNGTYLWLYNPSSGFCARQDVGGSSGGIIGLLSSYEGSIKGNNFIFKNASNYYSEIIVTTAGNMVRSVTLRHEDSTITYAFSGVRVGGGARSSLFNFKPPSNVQLVENPLNR